MAFLDFSHYAMNSCLSDVTIVIGEEKLFAHKIVLAAASPVWQSMLTSPMKESLENRIVIEDIDVDVMKVVLKCVYTGVDEGLDTVEMALEALAVAEKYDMKKFKALCEEKLCKKLTVDKALQILNYADTYRATTLQEACKEFAVLQRNRKYRTQVVERSCR